MLLVKLSVVVLACNVQKYKLTICSAPCTQGTHKSLKNNQKAKSTVGAIISATGSIGKPGLATSHPWLLSAMEGGRVRSLFCDQGMVGWTSA